MSSGKPLASKTRQIDSIPLYVLRKGRIHLLPVYQLASLSSVGKELILNQGSARYQDLVYRNCPEGRLLLGKLFDRYLLRFPTAVGCRNRLAEIQETLTVILSSAPNEHTQVLDLACGYGHCLIDTLSRANSNGIRGWGLDLDETAILIASSRAEQKGIHNVSFHVGDVLHPEDYPVDRPDVVVLSGIAQYLPYDQRVDLYHKVHCCLKDNGYLLTDYFCDWARSPFQRWWKRISEEFLGMKMDWLGREEVERMLSQTPFREMKTWYTRDNHCLMILARK